MVRCLVAGRQIVSERKFTLLWIGLLDIIGALGSALAQNVVIFTVARSIGGLGIGISTVVAPMYIAEIAPPKMRGRLGGMFLFNIVLGILIAFVSNQRALVGANSQETVHLKSVP